MPSSVLRSAVDAFVNSAAPSRNYGKLSSLHVKSGERFSYIYVNRAAPLGATITSAKLRIYQGAAWAGSRTLSLRPVIGAWNQSRLVWTNRPATGAVVATVTNNGGPVGTLVEFDVTAAMQSVSNGGIWLGFRVESSEATARAFVSSDGHSSYRPTLEVAWTEAPDAPTTLSPSGNRAVSTAKPILGFDFTDELGDTALQAVQVQIDPTGNWTAPAFDSGWVDATVPELDLATTAYAGLANLASTFWRVRVRDGAGLDSPWSGDEQFSRVDHSVVTITNPPAAVVNEPTPPILWSFTGVQTAWQVIISDAADPSKILADSNKRSGTVQAWTVPDGVLTRRSYAYRLEVRVWDDVARESRGLPVYASSSRVFTVEADVGVTPVSALAATQPEPKPRVRLTWTRPTAPDKYVVRRDGIVIVDELLPEDALVGGTSYVYDDDEAQTWHEHTWEVTSVVNNAESESTDVVYTPKQRGIWLLDKERDREVWIAGNESGSWALGEDATVFVPVGATQVVRRVQGQRGYEGQLSGILVDSFGRTSKEYEADLLAMRDEPARPVVLSLGDLTTTVILGNVTTYPTQHTPPARVASFEFWETST